MTGDEPADYDGVPAETLAKWAGEAESGFTRRQLKRGRPRLGPAAMDDLLAVRLDKHLADALDARAAQTHQTRSQVARDLLKQGLTAV